MTGAGCRPLYLCERQQCSASWAFAIHAPCTASCNLSCAADIRGVRQLAQHQLEVQAHNVQLQPRHASPDDPSSSSSYGLTSAESSSVPGEGASSPGSAPGSVASSRGGDGGGGFRRTASAPRTSLRRLSSGSIADSLQGAFRISLRRLDPVPGATPCHPSFPTCACHGPLYHVWMKQRPASPIKPMLSLDVQSELVPDDHEHDSGHPRRSGRCCAIAHERLKILRGVTLRGLSSKAGGVYGAPA